MKIKGRIFENLDKVLDIIRQESKDWKPPIAGTYATGKNAAFKVLISTVLSLRTKDSTTEKSANRLFKKAQTPEDMLKLSVSEIEKLIYPVGFYRVKAKNVIEICDILVRDFNSRVPDDLDTLLAFPGVGRKTANLTVTVGYNKPGICVDIHVHRISNRWGIVKTQAPDETEQELRKKLPQKYWIGFNDLLVSYGQNLCVPVSPFCSRCQLASLCPKIGVSKYR